MNRRPTSLAHLVIVLLVEILVAPTVDRGGLCIDHIGVAAGTAKPPKMRCDSRSQQGVCRAGAGDLAATLTLLGSRRRAVDSSAA